MSFKQSVFHRAEYVGGHMRVRVSILFGTVPVDGPRVLCPLSRRAEGDERKHEVEDHVAQILEGVRHANRKYDGDLQVEAVEVDLDCLSWTYQAEYLAYRIASAALQLRRHGTSLFPQA